jgi:peptidyl-prolyl cis-trans isomerase SurA
MNKIVHFALASVVVMALSFVVAQPVMASGANGIAATVNEEAILNSAVAARMKLVIISSGMDNDEQTRKNLRPQVINMLVDEALRMQEAKRKKIQVEEAAVEEGFAALASQNNLEPHVFKQALIESGVGVRTLHDQIRSQIAWNRVIQSELMSQVEVTEFDVDLVLKELASNAGKKEYLVAEIFLPVDDNDNEKNVKGLADRLHQQISGGHVRFSAIAAQFSQAAGAARGGDMGWVQENQLDEALGSALMAVADGQITSPIRSVTGYHILMRRGTRDSAPETMPSRDDVFNRVGMQNLERVQRRHFLNLKTSAFIDRRGA